MGEINVVPYIDVMLVLLIIFMVTAPMLSAGHQGGPAEGRGRAAAAGQRAAGAERRRRGRPVPEHRRLTKVAAARPIASLELAAAVLRREPERPVLVKADRTVRIRARRGRHGTAAAGRGTEGGVRDRIPDVGAAPERDALGDARASSTSTCGRWRAPRRCIWRWSGVLALAALRWSTSQPPVELAIEGYVVDGPAATERRRIARDAGSQRRRPGSAEQRVAAAAGAGRRTAAGAADRGGRCGGTCGRGRAGAQRRSRSAWPGEREAQPATRRRRRSSARRRKPSAGARRGGCQAQGCRGRERKQAEARRRSARPTSRPQAEREAKLSAEREADLQRRSPPRKRRAPRWPARA